MTREKKKTLKKIETNKQIESGILYGLDETVYRKHQGISASDLKLFKKSPRSFISNRLEKKTEERSSSLDIGALVDDAIYDLNAFRQSYFRLPVGARKKEVSDQEKAFLKASGAPEELTAKVFDEVISCAEAFQKHEIAGDVIRNSQPQLREVSFFWRDANSGLILKGRADLYDPRTQTIYDFKTTASSGRAAEYCHDFYRYGYHIQAAMYLAGLRANGIEAIDFAQLVVSKETYEVFPFKISDAAIMLAEQETKKLIKDLSECEQRKYYPYGGEAFQVLTLPNYAVTEIESYVGTLV